MLKSPEDLVASNNKPHRVAVPRGSHEDKFVDNHFDLCSLREPSEDVSVDFVSKDYGVIFDVLTKAPKIVSPLASSMRVDMSKPVSPLIKGKDAVFKRFNIPKAFRGKLFVPELLQGFKFIRA